jgi:hypothetical protein
LATTSTELPLLVVFSPPSCMVTSDPIEAAIRDILEGKMVIGLDDEDRENEGDLVMAAELVTRQR